MIDFSTLIKTNDKDEWYTPEHAVYYIVPYLKKRGYKKILCPFDKEKSNFVKVLKAEGFDVTYSHIDTGTDFFDIENIADFDAVVSNPPFSKRESILKRLFDIGGAFALILDMNGLFDSSARWRLFRDNPFELLVPSGRIHFFNDDLNMRSAPPFQSVYVCRGMCDQQIEFCEDYQQMTIEL